MAQFGGGINQGSLRTMATQAIQRIIRQKDEIRRTVPRVVSPPVVRPPVVNKPRRISVPVAKPVISLPPERAVPSLGQLTGGKPTEFFTAKPSPRGSPPARRPKPRPDPIDAIATKKEPDVSLHKSLLKSIGSGISGGISNRISGQKAMIALPAAAAAAGRVLPAIGRVLGSRTAAALGTGAVLGNLFGGGGADGCPSGYHPAKDGSGRCVRNRRMNYGNARAARRSVRRLKGARKLLQDIEKMMPRRKAVSRRPQHHHHPAQGG